MRSVLVCGGFDDIRSRDIRFLEEAAKIGPLTVRLLPDAKLPSAKFPFAERAYMLRALRFVATVEPDDGSPAFDAVWVVRECDAKCGDGFAYRVIAERALDGFPTSQPKRAGGAKTVAVSGCYDWLHSGHIRFFEEAGALGALHVFLGNDATIGNLKGPGHPQFSQEERRYVVAAVRHVHAAYVSRGSGWLDFAEDVIALRPDIFVVNEDGDKPSKRIFCRDHGIAYHVLKRTPAEGLPARSSTALRGF